MNKDKPYGFNPICAEGKECKLKNCPLCPQGIDVVKEYNQHCCKRHASRHTICRAAKCLLWVYSFEDDSEKNIYYLDRIKILRRAYKEEVEKGIPIHDLKKHCQNCSVHFTDEKSKEAGFFTMLNATAPNRTFFEILSKQKIFQDYRYPIHKISCIEIARDMLFYSIPSALDLFNLLKNHIIKNILISIG